MPSSDEDEERGLVNIPIYVYDDKEDDRSSMEMEETPVQKISRAALIMRDGNEIQRLSIVRNIPALMNEDADECLIKLLPVVQDVLRCTGSSNGAGLELHLASSDAYKEVIFIQHQRIPRDESDTRNNNDGPSIDLGLCSQILKGIVQNVESQDSIASSAWLDALLDVVDHLPICLLRSRVLPMACQKAQQLNCVQARLTATKLFGRLANKLDSSELKSEIIPLIQALCQDSNSLVRVSMCQQLPSLAQCMQLSELNSVALPLVIEFSKDEDESVREANLDCFTALIGTFDDVTCSRVLVPLANKFIEDTLNGNSMKNRGRGDGTGRDYSYTCRSVLALAKNYGLLCSSLKKHLDTDQKIWLVERFCELASLGAVEDGGSENEDDEDFPKSSRGYTTTTRDFQTTLTCRGYAAFNFPAIIRLASECSRDLVKTVVLAQFKRLCHDTETEVRIRIAAGFHELAKHLGEEASLLIDSFVDLVYSGDPEVINNLTVNLTETLECIYAAGDRTSSVDSNGNVVYQFPSGYTQLTRILLACNRLIRNGGNWRSHEQLLSALACLSRFITYDELSQSFMPMIKEEIVNARAVPCRIAALRTLVQWTIDTRNEGSARSVANYCLETLANNRSCHKRSLFLEACRMFIESNYVEFFNDYLLDVALKMVDDPVVNIRLKFCTLLPLLKTAVSQECVNEQLTKLEAAVKTMLSKDNQGYMGEIMKKAINEMARADAVDTIPKVPCGGIGTGKPPIRKKAEVVPIRSSAPASETPSSNDTSGRASREKTIANTDKEISVDNAKNKSVTSPSSTNPTSSSVSCSTTTNSSTNITMRTSLPTPITSGKKTAIVQPRQIISRSPSPRPPINQRSYEQSIDEASTKGSQSDNSSEGSKTRSANSIIDSYSRSSAVDSNTVERSTEADSIGRSASSNRVIPIRMVGSASERPPTPITTSRDATGSYNSTRPMRSSVTGISSSIRRTSAGSVRPLPGIQSGTVSRSIQRFETGTLGKSLRLDKDRRLTSSMTGIDYSRTSNRSFSSFGRIPGLSSNESRDNGGRSTMTSSDSRTDYSVSSPLRRSAYSSSRLSTDRGSYSLTRVRSGSSLGCGN